MKEGIVVSAKTRHEQQQERERQATIDYPDIRTTSKALSILMIEKENPDMISSELVTRARMFLEFLHATPKITESK